MLSDTPEIRETVFGWTNAEVSIWRQNCARSEDSRAPCHHGDGQSVWEIHPVMKMEVIPMKYWEIIADRLHAEGWSYGLAEHLTTRGLLSCVDAHRNGKRFIVGR
jgi:hypothetical protein